MLKRELKVNRKSFIIWTITCLCLFLMGFAIYPSFNTTDFDEILKTMPKEFLKMFNMDISSIGNVFGWVKTEGNTFLLLLTGLFASTLGSSIILKEESEKTIEYLHAKPIKRNDIIKNKLICGFIYISLMIIIVMIFNYVGLYLSGEFNKKEFFILSFVPLLAAIPFFLISAFIATFFDKTKKTGGISIGIVFLNYFLLIISNLNTNFEFLKYTSIYGLANSRDIIINNTIGLESIIIAIIISIVFILLIYRRYNKKELV